MTHRRTTLHAARGPLRPPKLDSVRTRRSRRLSSYLFRSVDVVAIAVVTVIWLRWAADGALLRSEVAEVAPFVAGAALLAMLLRTTGAYRFERSQGLVAHILPVAVCSAVTGLLVLAAAALADAGNTAERGALRWTFTMTATVCVLHLLWWARVRRWRQLGLLTPNIVLVGATSRAEQLIAEAIDQRHIHVLGIFDDRLNRSPMSLLGVPVLGSTHAMLEHRIMPHVDQIVVTVDPAAAVRVREIVTRLSVLPNTVTLMVDQDDERARHSADAHLADAPLAPVGRVADQERRAFSKRLQDLAIAIPGLVLVSPLLALAAIAVRLDSGGPVFFRQRRHGFNNEEIHVVKFRTMFHADTDARAERQVTAGDARVTRVGRFLRSSSVDDLPQLINVIRGEMSLVGPRPHAVGMKTGEVESAQLVAEYAHRHRIKPGMTGWAAIKGSRGPLHSPAEVKRRVALDIEYIERQSLWLDLKIIVLTLPSMLGDRSALR